MRFIDDWCRGSDWTNLIAKVKKLEGVALLQAMSNQKVPLEFCEMMGTKILFALMVQLLVFLPSATQLLLLLLLCGYCQRNIHSDTASSFPKEHFPPGVK